MTIALLVWGIAPVTEPVLWVGSGATRLPCTTSEQHLRWPILRCRRPAHMERAAVQPTRHWAIADYFQWTFENILILRRVLRPRRICDIYDFFAPFINLLAYLQFLDKWKFYETIQLLRLVTQVGLRFLVDAMVRGSCVGGCRKTYVEVIRSNYINVTITA